MVLSIKETGLNDQMNGEGTITYPDDAIYVGSLEKGVLNGSGKMIYADNSSIKNILVDKLSDWTCRFSNN